MITDEFQRTSLAFRGLSDEEPEEGGIPVNDGDLDSDKQLEEGLVDEEEEAAE